ncbi:MAG: histidine phosphatase family protein [SAR202 cluster bacterium]|jgi:probable phosphoglycerate mutase|nr:hypothetical protein [Chloroflexota bacterium]MQG57899.1 histidine phosphatase family protein [SAR202 cluster bacterium]MQG70230.1 histidine phosphatase family protein [SAR202 cluster bacterium]HAL48332.1 hypothetical protein [Dehalococcoidia bacterium]|tara:strand:- start:1482 stop:2207 length:726 start_codon:yes stop_codon:yes gene_type:complete
MAVRKVLTSAQDRSITLSDRHGMSLTAEESQSVSTNDINHMFLVRHGESEHHTNGMAGGWTDTPLTESGRQQISATAVHLRTLELRSVALYCSDLQRAIESAIIIGSELGCTPEPIPEFRELNNGDAAGLTLSEAAKIQIPEPISGNREAMLNWRPYNNAETWREMAQRVASALEKIKSNDAQATIIVGHALSGQALIQNWLKLPLHLAVSFQFDPASVTELRVNQWGEREIVRLNTSYHA